MDTSFFADVVDYLKGKNAALDLPKNDLFAAEERRKAETQLENIKNILKELYEKREKKIVSMALDMSRTGIGLLNSDIVDTSNMLKEEKDLFDYLVGVLNNSRKGVLFNILESKVPCLEDKKEIENKNSEEDNKSMDKENNPDNIENAEEENKTQKMIRFLHAVPKFVGEDLEEYGPFEQDDIANLSPKIADVLIAKERAEEMKKE